jgi:hypothetical protein
MLIIFSTPKPCNGDSQVIQRNALKCGFSPTFTQGFSPSFTRPRVLLLGF